MPRSVGGSGRRGGGSVRGGGVGGGGGAPANVQTFDRLTIADFEDDDAMRDNISDLESVADLPDEPTNSSSSVTISSAVFSVEPSATRAVYTVPTVVNFQNWEASRRWDDKTAAVAAAGGIGVAGRRPILTRVLILKNVDVADHAAVVSAPLTDKFALVARSGGGGALAAGDRAPFDLVLQPGASCTFDVQFFQPDDDELKFWDNFRDAVVIYTQRYSITVPFRALRAAGRASGTAASFTPGIEAMVLPAKPSDDHFRSMLDGRAKAVTVVPGPGGLAARAPSRASGGAGRAGAAAGHRTSCSNTNKPPGRARLQLTDSDDDEVEVEAKEEEGEDRGHDRRFNAGAKAQATSSSAADPLSATWSPSTPAATPAASSAPRGGAGARNAPNAAASQARRTAGAAAAAANVRAVDANDAAALILQMRRKMQQTAPVPGKFATSGSPASSPQRGDGGGGASRISAGGGGSGGGATHMLAMTTGSAEDIRRFQQEALRSNGGSGGGSPRRGRRGGGGGGGGGGDDDDDDEQEFYRSMMRRDVKKRIALGVGVAETTVASSGAGAGARSSRALAIARGQQQRRQREPEGPQYSHHHRHRQQQQQQQRAKTPGPQSKSGAATDAGGSSPGTRGGRARIGGGSAAPRVLAAAAASKLQATQQKQQVATKKKQPVLRAADEVDFYRSLLEKQKQPAGPARTLLPPRADELPRPQSSQDLAPGSGPADGGSSAGAGAGLGHGKCGNSRSGSAASPRRSGDGGSGGSSPPVVLNALRHPYGGSSKAMARAQQQRGTAYRPGQRITVRAPARRRRVP